MTRNPHPGRRDGLARPWATSMAAGLLACSGGDRCDGYLDGQRTIKFSARCSLPPLRFSCSIPSG